MFTARKSRLLRHLSREEEHNLLGASGGVLLSKSLQLSGEVYLAMQSRGYHHYPRTLDSFEWRWRDGLLMFFSLVVLVGIVFFA
jgi:cobalt/nickel transport system permease protein